jgi:hypothetical protein
MTYAKVKNAEENATASRPEAVRVVRPAGGRAQCARRTHEYA